MEILPVSTSNGTAVGDMGDLVKDQSCDNLCINDSPIFVCYPYLHGNPNIGTAVEYQKASLASIDMSTLDKPHFQLENLLRRFIHESNPDDADVSLDEIRDGVIFQVMYEHDGRQEMMQDKISELKVKRQKAQDQRSQSMKEQVYFNKI
ncbi:hypothetical protein Tco_0903896 [Tanacetum coccineum]